MNEQNNHKPLHPEIVKTVLKAANIKEPVENDLARIVRQAKQVTQEVRAIIGPIAELNPDPQAISQIISKTYLDKFAHWSKDELLFLIVIMHTENMAQQVL